jgi:hypothetical protein
MSRASPFTDAELAAYLAETLAVPRARDIEQALPKDLALRERLQQVLASENLTAPGISEIWRRRQLSCPTRTTWAAYVAEEIHGEFQEYLQFHLDVVGCRSCAANVVDLQQHGDAAAADRVRKIFETSVGRLQQLPSLSAQIDTSVSSSASE